MKPMEDDRPRMNTAQAEELRLAIKEAGWALMHLRRFYEMSKPEGAAPVDPIDPNQLNLFTDGR